MSTTGITCFGSVLVVALAFPCEAQVSTQAMGPECSECLTCPADPDYIMWRDIISMPDPSYWEGWLENWGCVSYWTCETPHIECDDYGDNDEQDEALLAELMPDISRAQLRTFVATHSGRLEWSMTRGAVQVIGCGDAVLETLPMRIMRESVTGDH